jgi:heptosyltransferase-2
VKRILVIQTAFLGDVVLTTPLVRALKQSLPEVDIAVLTLSSTSEVFKNNPQVAEIITYDKRETQKGVINLLCLVKEVKRRKFDVALIPHRSLRSAFLAWGADISLRVGFTSSSGYYFLNREVPYWPDCHEVERVLELLSGLGLEVVKSPPELFPDEEDHRWVTEFLDESIDDWVAIAPGSVWPTKRWLPERFAQLANMVAGDFRGGVVFVGGEEDRFLCRKIAEDVKGKCLVAAGEASVLQSAALFSKCRLLISNDSAPVHLASAVGTKVVDIYGPTVPQFGFYPHGEGHRIVEVEHLYCRPCSKHGPKRCPEGHFRCMREITVEKVFEAVAALLVKTTEKEVRRQ